MTIEQAETPTDEDPRERLRAWIHAVDMRLAMAKIEMPGGKASLGIMVQTEDPPAGRVTAQFDAEPFLDDLRAIVEADNLWEPPAIKPTVAHWMDMGLMEPPEDGWYLVTWSPSFPVKNRVHCLKWEGGKWLSPGNPNPNPEQDISHWAPMPTACPDAPEPDEEDF